MKTTIRIIMFLLALIIVVPCFAQAEGSPEYRLSAGDLNAALDQASRLVWYRIATEPGYIPGYYPGMPKLCPAYIAWQSCEAASENNGGAQVVPAAVFEREMYSLFSKQMIESKGFLPQIMSLAGYNEVNRTYDCRRGEKYSYIYARASSAAGYETAADGTVTVYIRSPKPTWLESKFPSSKAYDEYMSSKYGPEYSLGSPSHVEYGGRLYSSALFGYNGGYAAWEGDYFDECGKITFAPDVEGIHIIAYEDIRLVDIPEDLTAPPVTGDLNGDGKLDHADYAMLKRYLLGTYKLSEEQIESAKTALPPRRSGSSLSAADYAMIKRHVLGTYVIVGAEGR